MNIQQQALAMQLANDHLWTLIVQAKDPSADELTQESLKEAASIVYKLALNESLNYDERQVFIAMVNSHLEDETVSLDEHELAIKVLSLV